MPPHMGQPSPQQLQALFEYQAQIKANVTAAAAAASAASNKTNQLKTKLFFFSGEQKTIHFALQVMGP